MYCFRSRPNFDFLVLEELGDAFWMGKQIHVHFGGSTRREIVNGLARPLVIDILATVNGTLHIALR